ncbi:hypothetical protein M422DRAFT_241979 [Sphaerobolus stellatus SS14]|nr:hypothetical protein M422DRAFT_241979 [Sphaerobolus stellatus SS14]
MDLTLSELIAFLDVEDTVIAHNLAASAFLFWDQLITMREEIELIWCTKWSLVTIVFFISRYVTFTIRAIELVFYTNVSHLLHPSVTGCFIWIWFEALSGHTVISTVEILMMMRIYAFYGRNKNLLIFLFALFTIEHAISLYFLAKTVPHFQIFLNTLPPSLRVSVCIVGKIPDIFTNYWIPCLAFQFILFVLLIAKFFHTKWNTTLSTPHLLAIFVRDGAWAFALIFAALLWAAAAFKSSTQEGDIALTWLYSVLGFTGSRLILNLRSAARERAWMSGNMGQLYVINMDTTMYTDILGANRRGLPTIQD